MFGCIAIELFTVFPCKPPPMDQARKNLSTQSGAVPLESIVANGTDCHATRSGNKKQGRLPLPLLVRHILRIIFYAHLLVDLVYMVTHCKEFFFQSIEIILIRLHFCKLVLLRPRSFVARLLLV